MKTEPSIGIIMGSQSDWPTLKYSANILDEFDIVYETKIISAHRTPDRLWEYGKAAVTRGLKDNNCWCWWRCSFTWYDGIKNAYPHHRRSNTNTSLIWSRQLILNRPNATWFSRRNNGDRINRSIQRRAHVITDTSPKRRKLGTKIRKLEKSFIFFNSR